MFPVCGLPSYLPGHPYLRHPYLGHEPPRVLGGEEEGGREERDGDNGKEDGRTVRREEEVEEGSGMRKNVFVVREKEEG